MEIMIIFYPLLRTLNIFFLATRCAILIFFTTLARWSAIDAEMSRGGSIETSIGRRG